MNHRTSTDNECSWFLFHIHTYGTFVGCLRVSIISAPVFKQKMGNNFTINMEENFKKNQDFITEMNNIKIERQLQMRNQMRERQFALEIAKQRELFYWIGAFYITSVIGAVARYKRKLSLLTPLVPLTFIFAYQADLAYGNKLHRILVEAEHIMQFEEELLELPLGVPTPASIDLKRMQNDEQKRLHPHLPSI